MLSFVLRCCLLFIGVCGNRRKPLFPPRFRIYRCYKKNLDSRIVAVVNLHACRRDIEFDKLLAQLKNGDYSVVGEDLTPIISAKIDALNRGRRILEWKGSPRCGLEDFPIQINDALSHYNVYD
jgi:hypothetical protein